MTTPHPNNHNHATVPLLVPTLRAALRRLYSLPPTDQNNHYHHDHHNNGGVNPLVFATERDANDFLVSFRGRNARRRRRSSEQRRRDSSSLDADLDGDDVDEDPVGAEDVGGRGSTWAACAWLVGAADARPSERLFGAQTLLHRSRRMDATDAVDVEEEDDPGWWSAVRPDADRARRATALCAEIARRWWHPWAARVATAAAAIDPVATSEERAKSGTATATLAALSFVVASSASSSSTSVAPTLTTLGAALTTMAMRRKGGGEDDDTSSSLIHLVVSSLEASATAIGSTFGPIPPRVVHDLAVLVVSTLPESAVSSVCSSSYRLSVDPRVVRRCAAELRDPATGVQLYRAVLERAAACPGTHRPSLWRATETWAARLPVDVGFVEWTVAARASSNSNEDSGWCAAAIALFDAAATVTPERVVATAMGVATRDGDNNHNGGGDADFGKRNGNSFGSRAKGKGGGGRSRRRRRDKLDSRSSSTPGLWEEARRECVTRREVACHFAHLLYERTDLDGALEAASRSAERPDAPVDGEGVVGLVASCARTCLPHLIRTSDDDDEVRRRARAALFGRVADSVRRLCAHPNRGVRVFAFAPVAAARDAVADSPPSAPGAVVAVADRLYECAAALAAGCAYPAGYFRDLSADGDGELENERNDVRDVIRRLCSSADGERHAGACPVQILDRLIAACRRSVAAVAADDLPPESVVHALSATAKPLRGLLGTTDERSTTDLDGTSARILGTAFDALADVCARLSIALRDPRRDDAALLPVSRLASLATASTAPALAAAFAAGHEGLRAAVVRCAREAVGAAVASLRRLPELYFPSTLRTTSLYDVRGAMRGPGGEDHVACLALRRLVDERRDFVVGAVVGDDDLPAVLFASHEDLKRVETARGPLAHHGRGVAPMSRRILLRVAAETASLRPDARPLLEACFARAIASVPDVVDPRDDAATRVLCETVFDLAALPPFVAAATLRPDPAAARAFACVVRTTTEGYRATPTPGTTSRAQWARLRCAVVALLRACLSDDDAVPSATAREAVVALARAECAAAFERCRRPDVVDDDVFRDDVVGETTLPAGGFLILLAEELRRVRRATTVTATSRERCRDCALAAHRCREAVFAVLATPAPELVDDPRPTIAEAWYRTVDELVASSRRDELAASPAARDVVDDSCAAAVLSLLRDDDDDDGGGASTDGPHTLALLDALVGALESSGPDALRAIGTRARTRSAPDGTRDDVSAGGALLVAGLLRAASGGLPPWAAERAPRAFRAALAARGNDVAAFLRSTEAGWEARSATGRRLAGRHVAHASERARRTFLDRTREAAEQNNGDAWRRFKVALKAACGGKKKDAGFNLKPSATCWECDRV